MVITADDRRAAGLVRANHRAVVVCADAIHPLRRARSRHPSEERHVVAADVGAIAAKVAGGGHGCADHQDVGIGRLNGKVSLAQHVDVVLWVHLTIARAAILAVQVGHVPHLDCVSALSNEVSQVGCELAVIVRIRRPRALAHCTDQHLETSGFGRRDPPRNIRILGLELHPGHADVAHLVKYSGAAYVPTQFEDPVLARARGPTQWTRLQT